MLQAAVRAGEGEAVAARLDFSQPAMRNGGNREFGVCFSFVLKKQCSKTSEIIEFIWNLNVETMLLKSDF